MPQSLSKVYVHLIVSTQRREPLLIPSVRGFLNVYLSTVLKNQDCPALKICSTSDRAHLLCHAHLLFRSLEELAVG